METAMERAEESARERFAAAVREHGRAMFRAARSLLDSDAAAEDAVGQAVLLAWQAFSSLRRQEAVRPWLIKITVNCARQQRRKDGRITFLADVPETAAVQDGYNGLWEAVCALPRDSRAVICLFYYEDMTVAEISKTLGIAQGTVKSRLSRARERLKALLCQEE